MTEPKTYRTIARLYDLLDLPFEHFRYRRIRPQLWQGFTGRVLDAGVGTGRNMPHYPKAAEMTGLDLSPAMLMRARQRRQALGIAVTLQQGNICATGFPDGHFDAVASSFRSACWMTACNLPRSANCGGSASRMAKSGC